MLVVRSISSGVVPYFADGRDAGTWTAGAARLLDLRGPVEPAALRAVLSGRHPTSGAFLPAVRSRRRRAGWDLVFAAPKSVSLLGATTDLGEDVAAAHRAAVRQCLEYLERRLTVARASEPSGTAPAGGLIAACFQHVANAAAEPHLHTHALVANLTQTDRGWSAVRNEGWFVGRRSVAVLFQMALRAELRSRGWQLEWRLHSDGSADVAEVPSAAVRATSTQGRRAATAGAFLARQEATPRQWRDEAERAGWGASSDLVSPLRGPVAGGEPRSRLAAPAAASDTPEVRVSPVGIPSPPDSDLAARVTARLALRRSDFSEADVIVALGASLGPGASPEEAAVWAERFCRGSLPVPSPTAGGRWTTALARGADGRLVEALRQVAQGAPRPGGGAPRLLPDGRTVPARPGVLILGAPPGRSALLAQAEQVGLWRQIWSAGGVSAAVECPTALAAARWAVLSGLPPHQRGRRVDVMVVDQADRRSSPDLLRLAGDALRSGSSLVLVEGGTLPRVTNFASHGLALFAAEADRLVCHPTAGWAWTAPAPVGDGHLRRDLSGRLAVEALLGRWATEAPQHLLVGLGLEEVRALNLMARRLAAGGKAQRERDDRTATADFRAGDRVVVIKARDGLPAYGTFGEVVDDAGPGGTVSVSWPGEVRPATYGASALSGLGHGWAVTAHMAARLGRPVMVLGSADALPRLRGLVRATEQIEPPGRRRTAGLER